jgi:putative transposase
MRKTDKIKRYQSKKNKHLHDPINLSGRAYNHAIALHRRSYKLTGKPLNQYALMKHFSKLKALAKYAWLKLIPSQALQDLIQRIEKGYQLFFLNLKAGVKTAPPGFRKVAKFKSYPLKQAGWRFVKEHQIKIGDHIYKLVKDRLPQGSIKPVTLKRDSLGDLSACFSVETELPQSETMSGQMAGFDFGLRQFLTVYDGQSVHPIDAPLFFKQSLKLIKKLSKALSKKKNGSNNRRMAKRALAREHKRIADKRRDWFFKLAHELTDKYDCLFFEDLSLKGMKALWGRKVSDLAFGEFLSILKYVASLKGCVVHFIGRFFPSSKLCSHCGFVNRKLELSDRRWRCPNCQEIVDRDGNAAVNIYREGASSLGVADIRPDLFGPSVLIPEPHLF